MPEISDVLEAYDYAETIRVELPGGVTADLAEANTGRNGEFARAVFVTALELKKDNLIEFPIEERVRIFCETILKNWNITVDGEKVAPKDAASIFLKDRAGNLLFREMFKRASTPDAFHKAESKKKPSSTSTPKGGSSASRRKPSRSRRKPAAEKSPKESARTSKA